ncbi:redoxin family protein [Candidatus Kaiserbacteria bacterium]|nr:redoxin family protein [Candidatus Kaiserbacteria bacterium]
MLLLLISFVAGVLTALAPCVLPLLPVIVGGSLAGGSRRRAYTICISLGVSIIAFTLLLKATTILLGVPQYVWQWISGGILLAFGITMVFPQLWDALPLINSLSRGSNALLAVGYRKNSIAGDALMGAALGPVFASCSPTYFVILATVLPASFLMGLADLLAYALGLSGFLLVIALAGQKLVDRLGVTIEPGGWFRRGIGALFILVGVLVATGTMQRIEVWLLDQGLFDITGIEQRLLGAPAEASSPQEAAEMISAEAKELMYKKAPELVEPDHYINTPRLPSGQAGPITIGEFRGKNPVLVDIWTYSCINCQRTLPYLRMWHEKYAKDGLIIIGVHTPEFAFEQVPSNVEAAVRDFGLKYPVVLDNEYKTWNAFGNRFWPRKYLIDIDGYIVYDHAGEGAYEETEQAIQNALAERAKRLGMKMPSQEIASPADVMPVDFSQVQSPEVYFGSDRNDLLGNGKRGVEGVQTLEIPEKLFGNTLYLGGVWNIQTEYAEAAAGASIQFIYSAKNVYMVASSERGARLKVTLDGKPRTDSDANTTILDEELYPLTEGQSYGTHLLEITIEEGSLKIYTFTFG